MWVGAWASGGVAQVSCDVYAAMCMLGCVCHCDVYAVCMYAMCCDVYALVLDDSGLHHSCFIASH